MVIAVIAIIASIGIPQIMGVRDAATAARNASRMEERLRFVGNVRGLGGAPLDPAALTNGQTVVISNVSGTNTITLTYWENL